MWRNFWIQHNAGMDQKFSQRRRAQSFGVPGTHFLAVRKLVDADEPSLWETCYI